MNSTVFTTIAVTGFTLAFLHAAIPTHRLPFTWLTLVGLGLLVIFLGK